MKLDVLAPAAPYLRSYPPVNGTNLLPTIALTPQREHRTRRPAHNLIGC